MKNVAAPVSRAIFPSAGPVGPFESHGVSMSIVELPKVNESNRPAALHPVLPTPDESRPVRGYLKSLDDLDAINFYCFGGRRDFSAGFRALVVGSNSDSAIDLADQLQDKGASVVYVDASDETVDFAQQRAAQRGVRDDIEWTQADPEALSELGLEPFDYVNGCGLLESHADAAAAIKLLKLVLKPDGAIGLSLPGKYGQTGLAQMRDLMRIVNHNTPETADAVANARAVIDRLPATNWCKRAVDLYPIYNGLSDREVYDHFLRPSAPSYSLPDLWESLESNGLLLIEHTREQRALCEPRFAFPPGPLLTQISQLPRREQQAATELYWGAITRHTCWVTPRPDTVAPLTDPEMIPFFSRFAVEHDIQQSILNTTGDEWSWSTRLAGEVDVSITFHVAPAARRFVELVDNQRTLAEIIEAILSAYNPRPPIEEAMKISRYVMEVLLRQDLLLVRHESTSASSTAE